MYFASAAESSHSLIKLSQSTGVSESEFDPQHKHSDKFSEGRKLTDFFFLRTDFMKIFTLFGRSFFNADNIL